MKTYSKEMLYEVWDDENGCHFEVGPDRDGLLCIEIRYLNEQNVVCDRIMFPPEVARLIAEALTDLTARPGE